MRLSEALLVRAQMEQTFSLAASSMSSDEIIRSRVLCKPWKPGKHNAGEIYAAADQVWYCIQGYDNAIYPDIKPENAAWNTFHKPYHGTTPDTAMPWVQPTGAHDIYLTGEYMVWTDGLIYRCVSSTNYSPADYAPAWEVAG